MSAQEKLAQADDRLREIDAGLRHLEQRLAGSEEKLTAQVADRDVPPTSHPHREARGRRETTNPDRQT
jgi:hypothetical protein